jgi:hypothetical protein
MAEHLIKEEDGTSVAVTRDAKSRDRFQLLPLLTGSKLRREVSEYKSNSNVPSSVFVLKNLNVLLPVVDYNTTSKKPAKYNGKT